MSFLKRLFGGSKQAAAANPGLEQHLDYLNTLRLPAIAFFPASASSLSRLGGLPSLPAALPWPEWKGKPLAFLCQINLAELPDDCERSALPSSGLLYFFYNQGQETWGFDPEDAGSWRVLYADAPSANGAPRAAPAGMNEDGIYPEKPVALVAIKTYPDSQDERVSALNMNDIQSDQYCELTSRVFNNGPGHHLLGHPSPVQNNDMDLECQLASHGLNCGGSMSASDPRVKELESGRQDWMLLLELDTDDDAGMMWGDCGKLYFWIRRDDLKNKRFDKSWMILQCS